MEAVNIHIGPLVFDHANYDADGDVLYLHVDPLNLAKAKRRPRATSFASPRAASESSA